MQLRRHGVGRLSQTGGATRERMMPQVQGLHFQCGQQISCNHLDIARRHSDVLSLHAQPSLIGRKPVREQVHGEEGGVFASIWTLNTQLALSPEWITPLLSECFWLTNEVDVPFSRHIRVLRQHPISISSCAAVGESALSDPDNCRGVVRISGRTKGC